MSDPYYPAGEHRVTIDEWDPVGPNPPNAIFIARGPTPFPHQPEGARKWNRYYWCNCPRCGQYGALLVSLFRPTGQMCLHCDECLAYWLDPESLDDFDPDGEYGMFPAPTEEQIDAAGWRKYCKNRTFEPTDYGTELDDEEEEEPPPRHAN